MRSNKIFSGQSNLISHVCEIVLFLFFCQLSDKTYTGSVDVPDNESKTEAQSIGESSVPDWDNNDMCPILSLEAERFSFVSGFTRDITGQCYLCSIE